MAQHLKYEEWINTVKSLCTDQDEYEYFTEYYSWITAFDECLTPLQAYRDCKEWMNS